MNNEIMNNYFQELWDAMCDLYFKDGERVLFDGFYKIASWCEEGDWQYVVYYRTEDDEWDTWEDCCGYFCYFDNYTKEITELPELAKNWIFPFFIEDLKKQIAD